MFTIVVSEKGGAERRETFDVVEVTFGRVQGNELVLPRGNVSKRHARLVFRDSRFIVTDLNSTNGTYVNRRRIAQPTIVREGDRIYVGDYVLRLEAGEPSGERASVDATSENLRLERSTRESFPEAAAELLAAEKPAVDAVELVAPSPPPEPELYSSLPITPAGHDEALSWRAQLMARVEARLTTGALDNTIDASVRASVEELVREEARSLSVESTSKPPLEVVTKEALDELLGHGVLGELLADRSVCEVYVPRFDRVLVMRDHATEPSSTSFASEGSLRRIIARLASAAGIPRATTGVVEFRLPEGGWLLAVLGETPRSPASLMLRREAAPATSMEELVRRGTVSRAMASFLTQAVAARANILVTGPRDAGTEQVVSALLDGITEAPLLLVEDGERLIKPWGGTPVFSLDGARAETRGVVSTAARTRAARLVVDANRALPATAVLDALLEGADGAVVRVLAGSAPRALLRLAADLASLQRAIPLDVARELVGGLFDLVVEVHRLRDGRQRVMRISQAEGLSAGGVLVRDLFTFTVERAASADTVEGNFLATGLVPRFVESLEARGLAVDMALFSRPPSR